VGLPEQQGESMAEVVKHPHPILDKVVEPITDFSLAWLAPIRDALVETIEKHNAVGLAANQVGIDQRAIGIRTRNGNIRIFFNPVVVSESSQRSTREEACLSLPGVLVEVSRADRVQFTHTELDEETGQPKAVKEQMSGLAAAAVAHEIDHLNGRSITYYQKAQAA
jgi:peptide deformylase